MGPITAVLFEDTCGSRINLVEPPTEAGRRETGGNQKPLGGTRMGMRRWLKVLLAAAKGWSADNAFKHSAAVSFYTLFSLAPLTIIGVGLAGLVLGRERATRQFSAQMTELVGKDGAKAILATLDAARSPHANWISTVTGIVILLIGATSVFGQLQDSLNDIWSVRAQPRRSGLAVFLLQRLLSFGMVLTVGFLLLVSLVLTTAIQAMVHTADGRLSLPPAALQAIEFVSALAVITVLFTAFFKILPDVQLPWRGVWPSALLTAALFSVGRVLIATYLAHSTVASVYGAAGSLVALLVWIYYSCAIMFYGVEIIRYDRMQRRLPVKPKKTAVLVRQEIVR
jgi:membrane protein